jgi:hypothetical protein
MGSYVDNNLIRDETVVYETKYHWKIFFSLAGLFTLFIYPFNHGQGREVLHRQGFFSPQGKALKRDYTDNCPLLLN